MKQSGFTMIELVIVIVVLGILAAVAAPKFMDVQNDAKISATKGQLGAIRSGVGMAHAKVLTTGQNTGVATANEDWPTLAELQRNQLANTRPVATLRGLEIVESDVTSGTANQSLPAIKLPTMNAAQLTAARTVTNRNAAQATARTAGANNSGWAYFPGAVVNGRVADAVVFVFNSNATNVDGEARTPNQW